MRDWRGCGAHGAVPPAPLPTVEKHPETWAAWSPNLNLRRRWLWVPTAFGQPSRRCPCRQTCLTAAVAAICDCSALQSRLLLEKDGEAPVAPLPSGEEWSYATAAAALVHVRQMLAGPACIRRSQVRYRPRLTMLRGLRASAWVQFCYSARAPRRVRLSAAVA